MSCLVFKDKQGRRIEVAIDKPEIRVGRQAGNDVVIPFRTVSRTHCSFTSKGDGVYLKDLGSSTGTTVNDATLQGEALLKDRDQVKIGEFRIRFYERSKYPEKSLSMEGTQSVVLFGKDVARAVERGAGGSSDATGAGEAPRRRSRLALIGMLLIGAAGAAAAIAAALVIAWRMGVIRVGAP